MLSPNSLPISEYGKSRVSVIMSESPTNYKLTVIKKFYGGSRRQGEPLSPVSWTLA